MKNWFFLFFFLIAYAAQAQTITGNVLDSATNKPLAYAIVIYNFQKSITYTDANGIFYIQKDSLTQNDSVSIQFVGYKKILIAASSIKNGSTFMLAPEVNVLNPVIVYACRKTRDYEINRRIGRIKHYIGPGPETKFIVLAKYNNTSGRNGYVSAVQIFLDQPSPDFKVPIRFRWYQWDATNKKPGRELTDTNIIVYPTQDGWNNFALPAYVVTAPKDYIVFGLEFIYPTEYKQEYTMLKSAADKIKWLTNMQHRWSLGMQYSNNESDAGFYSINNGPFSSYNQRDDRYYMRPALILTITACAEKQ